MTHLIDYRHHQSVSLHHHYPDLQLMFEGHENLLILLQGVQLGLSPGVGRGQGHAHPPENGRVLFDLNSLPFSFLVIIVYV